MDDSELDLVLSTTAALLAADGKAEAVDLLQAATPRLEEAGWDNWNGGITLWTIRLPIEPAQFARLGERRTSVESDINRRLATVIEQRTDDRYSVTFSPKLLAKPDWRRADPGVSEATRRNIIDGLKLENVAWCGRLDQVEFLQRIWDLKRMPASDNRYPDAASDIWQHTVSNDDWDPDWVYTDTRFNLFKGPTDRFLQFLCEIVHPVVRPDRDQADKIVAHINDQLRRDSWELYSVEKIAGRPRYDFRNLRGSTQRSVSRARTVADALNASWMQQEIERLENAVETDPALAIGTAKELVETCCKTILTRRKVEFSRGADLGDLGKLVTKELKLVPDDIPDSAKGAENVKMILRNLISIPHHLAQLRGLYGTGHGRDGQHRGLGARHARLAAASAVAYIDFVSDTYRQRELQAAPPVAPISPK